MNQDIENIIKKFDDIYLDKNSVSGLNQKDFKSFPDIVKHIRTNFIPLIADEVLKVIVEKIKEFKCEVPPTPNNLGKIYTEEMVNKVIKYVGRFNYNKALDDLLSNLSPKENKNNG